MNLVLILMAIYFDEVIFKIKWRLCVVLVVVGGGWTGGKNECVGAGRGGGREAAGSGRAGP